jgi:hypothetical protein
LETELRRVRVADRDETQLAEACAEERVLTRAVVGVAQRAVASVVGLADLTRAHVLHQEGHAPEAAAGRAAREIRERLAPIEDGNRAELRIEALDALDRRGDQVGRGRGARFDERRLSDGVQLGPFRPIGRRIQDRIRRLMS